MQSRNKRWAGCVSAILLLAASTQIPAEETAPEKSARAVSNIGFEKNPPAALKQKFPMCDEYLKVQWITKKKEIGYSEFEAPLTSVVGNSVARKKVSVLVLMRDPFGAFPELRYDVSSIKESGQLERLFDALRNGKIKGAWGGTNLLVESKDYNFRIDFNSVELEGHPYSFEDEVVFADYQQTVCVVYPNGQRAWIAEGRRPEKIYDKATFDALFNNVKASIAGLDRRVFARTWVLDVNRDGIPDYVGPGSIYSVGNRYYGYHLVEGTGPSATGAPTKKVPTYSFPPQNRTCAVKAPTLYLTTDGKDYFLNNQCNLTDLTSQAGEK
jgi:hypothetical protein